MKKLILAIDCDDVLISTAPWILQTYNSTYDTQLDLKSYYSSDVSDWRVESLDEASARIGRIVQYAEYASLKPSDETIRAIMNLATKHELHLVTGRATYLEPITTAMVDTYFPSIFQSINHTGYFEGAKRGKSDICVELGVDILVDDHIVHLNDVLNAGLREVILFGDYPWNTVEQLPDGVARCVNWTEVQREVGRIAER